MKQTIHFLVGLPRSGSTVLASILCQHPQVHATHTSPLLGLMIKTYEAWHNMPEVIANPNPQQLTNITRGMINGAWLHINKEIIIDKNRGWMRNMPASSVLFERDVKVIATVRDLPSIMASWLTLMERNPRSDFDIEVQQRYGSLTNEYRMEHMWNCVVRDCVEGYQQLIREAGERVVTVHYDDLVRAPASSLESIHAHLGLPYWRYEFDKIESGTQDDDLSAWGFQGMHTIRHSLNKTALSPREVLGCNLYDTYERMGKEYGL